MSIPQDKTIEFIVPRSLVIRFIYFCYSAFDGQYCPLKKRWCIMNRYSRAGGNPANSMHYGFRVKHGMTVKQTWI
jgi:hypothetical protein